MYQYGQGVQQNYEMAIKWYKLAADQGNVDGQYALGYLYENGFEHLKKALAWYTLAAEQNDGGDAMLLVLCIKMAKA